MQMNKLINVYSFQSGLDVVENSARALLVGGLLLLVSGLGMSEGQLMSEIFPFQHFFITYN